MIPDWDHGGFLDSGVETPKEALRRATLRDLDYLIECAEDYRRGLTGGTCSHSLQDIEHVAKGMRDRFEAFAKKAGKERA